MKSFTTCSATSASNKAKRISLRPESTCSSVKEGALFSLEKIKETEEELKQGIFTMDSYLSQLRQMKKMGGMEGVMSMLPGVNKMKAKMDQANIDERMLIENEAIILSMTKNEKENPKIISGSRRKRISQGAGVDVSKINKLLKQFKMMSDMMKKMSQGKKIPSGMIPDEMLNKLK
jgi:signal recognition particle subunit SRP54